MAAMAAGLTGTRFFSPRSHSARDCNPSTRVDDDESSTGDFSGSGRHEAVLFVGPVPAKPGGSPHDSGLRRNRLPRTRSGDGGVVWAGHAACRWRPLTRSLRRAPPRPPPLPPPRRPHPSPRRRSGASRNPVGRRTMPAPSPISTRGAWYGLATHHPQARPLGASSRATYCGNRRRRTLFRHCRVCDIAALPQNRYFSAT